jgi:hypothetical protein
MIGRSLSPLTAPHRRVHRWFRPSPSFTSFLWCSRWAPNPLEPLGYPSRAWGTSPVEDRRHSPLGHVAGLALVTIWSQRHHQTVRRRVLVWLDSVVRPREPCIGVAVVDQLTGGEVKPPSQGLDWSLPTWQLTWPCPTCLSLRLGLSRYKKVFPVK